MGEQALGQGKGELACEVEQVFQLVNRFRKARGLVPLPGFLRERLKPVLEEALTEAGEFSPEQQEALQAAQEVLQGLASRLGLTMEDFLSALDYWHRKDVVSTAQYQLLRPLLAGEAVPFFEVEELRQAVFAFANRCQRSLSGRRGVRMARMGVVRRKSKEGASL